MEKKNWEEQNNQEIEEILKKIGKEEKVPEKLKPEQMKKFLEENTGRKRKYSFSKWHGVIAAAACLVLLVSVGRTIPGIEKDTARESVSKDSAEQEEVKDTAEEVYSTSYEELYAFFEEQEKEREAVTYPEEEKEQDMAADASGPQGSGAEKEYADTNKQEAGVDEADIIKNDGRYLYQIVTNSDYSQAVQIADTENGLKEAARIEGFENISEIYVQGDILAVIEPGWAEDTKYKPADYQSDGEAICYDVARGKSYQKIHIYNIKERKQPEKQHVFTVEGDYLNSRVSDGYLYLFVTRGIDKLNGLEKQEDYIPVLDGKIMDASDIYLPTGAKSMNYLVMVSVALKQPEEFADTKAVVTAADRVYVTDSNIYVADSIQGEHTEKEGIYSNKTNLIRFSYKNGKMRKEAEGSVKGVLLDDMAINESNGYLRMAVTVETYQKKQIIDDVFGTPVGYDTERKKKDNSLYVLNPQLEVVGMIEGLAEEEQIYSARFMGDTGYFVTFRQTDPLFSVDLSDPENPKILGELKISGFSEYLHFYNENLLLGIGMEADENTGRTEGMKLSMFDISNPAQVTEQNKYSLEGYNYSDALYNYKAVLIDTEKNLFGFYAEGYNDGEEKADYLLFAYENGAFKQKMKVSCDRDKNGIQAQVRGTYIGDMFYLMYGDGRIESYSLKDGTIEESIDLFPKSTP